MADVEFPDSPILSLPVSGHVDTLVSSDQHIDFSWSSADIESENTFFILENDDNIHPIFTQNMLNDLSTQLSYDTLLSMFGYVDNKEFYWGVYTRVNGEVSISELNTFEISLINQLSIDGNNPIPNKYLSLIHISEPTRPY